MKKGVFIVSDAGQVQVGKIRCHNCMKWVKQIAAQFGFTISGFKTIGNICAPCTLEFTKLPESDKETFKSRCRLNVMKSIAEAAKKAA